MSDIYSEVSDILGEYVEEKTFDRVFTSLDQTGKITAKVRNQLIVLLIKHIGKQ